MYHLAKLTNGPGSSLIHVTTDVAGDKHEAGRLVSDHALYLLGRGYVIDLHHPTPDTLVLDARRDDKRVVWYAGPVADLVRDRLGLQPAQGRKFPAGPTPTPGG